jgi:hypothetical protein
LFRSQAQREAGVVEERVIEAVRDVEHLPASPRGE